MSKVLEASVRLWEKTSEALWDWSDVECEVETGEPSLRTDVQVLVPTLDQLAKLGDLMLQMLAKRLPVGDPDRESMLVISKEWQATLHRN